MGRARLASEAPRGHALEASFSPQRRPLLLRSLAVKASFRDAAKLVITVVQAGDHQRGHLDLDPELMIEPNGIQDGLQPGAADAPIGLIAEELDIDVDRIEQGRNSP